MFGFCPVSFYALQENPLGLNASESKLFMPPYSFAKYYKPWAGIHQPFFVLSSPPVLAAGF
jgi:hypothetical protein